MTASRPNWVERKRENSVVNLVTSEGEVEEKLG